MATDPFVLECSGLPAATRVLAFEGTEEISTTYRYEIDLLVDPEADLGDAVGASATLTVLSENPERGAVHGVIGSARIIENLDDQDLYRVVMVPRVRDVLGLDRHSRVFVGETVPSIVQMLLRDAGFRHEDCEFRLSRDYDPIDFVCQYRESTLDFLMRWMERDGIYFYFAHNGTQERLVILDDRAQHAPPVVLAPYQKSVGLQELDGLRRFRAERRTVPGRVHVDDYDYLRPALPVRGEALVEGGNGGELRVRGAKVTTPKEAERIAKLRAEGLRARQTIFRGEGRLHGLHAGEIFTLSGHPRATLDGNYLVTKLHVRGHHTGDLGEKMKELLGREGEPDDVVRVELEALWGDVQFRPELQTQPPRVYSMEGGVIEGDVDSDYAQLDEHGRYLVKFRFDEREGRGSQASARIRMMQPHAGSPEGMHFPLRKGTDVLIAFVGGDPDRPVIAGSVPNALTPSVVHSGNATTNVIRTGGRNLIQIEDQEGAQHIHLRTPHKNTYLHLGAPFNPTYTKATVTDGTSISYTRDISTSVTGTDAQTLVENSRVTIIGRGFISPTDKQGQEVVTLVGKEFLDQTPVDFLLAQIDADVKQAATDMQTLALAVEKLNSAIKAAAAAAATAAATAAANGQPPPAYTESLDIETDLAAVQSAIKTALADLTTLQADAEAYKSDATSDATSAGQWLQDVGVAVSSMTTASTDATNASAATALPDMTAFNTDVTAAFGSAQTALGTDSNFVIIKGQTPPPQLPGKTMAHLPDPSTQPNYIAIKHIPTQTTSMDSTDPPATIDAWIGAQSLLTVDSKGNPLDIPAIETSDATAINSGPTPPLNSGSDVKIVGGDNVTMVANDARSDTGGHAYTLVGRNKTPTAGQTSVVYGGATSTVYSQSKINSSGPDATPATGDTAQSTVVWGDATSSLHGSQTSHIGDNWGNTHSTVIQGSRSVAITGPVDAYNFIGVAKESAVAAGAIVDVKVTGVEATLKVALSTIDYDFRTAWKLTNKLSPTDIETEVTTKIEAKLGPQIKEALAPVISQETLDIKNTMAAIHSVQTDLQDKISAIHVYNIHVHLGFSIFGPP